MNSRYEILEQLGEGGEASVWKAWDTRLQRYVAIKQLLPASRREVPDAGDIFAEASALSALQHPNIVSVYDVEDDPEIGPYVVMEFLNGENLEQTIQRGGLTHDDFVVIAGHVLEGLVAAHKLGMQHRDIKPSNIMLNWLPDQKFVAKLLDFGLAKFTTRPIQQTVKGHKKILGSIFFMAPEQFQHRPLDCRSDLYSLGCVFYYILTTKTPFAGGTPSQVIQSHLDHMVAPLRDARPDLPPLLCDWVMWLIRRQPEHRPKDATQALEIFRGILDGSLTELPQSVTGLRTTSVVISKRTGPTPVAAATKKKGLLIGGSIAAVAGIVGVMIALKKDPAPTSEEKAAPPPPAESRAEPVKPTSFPTSPPPQGLVFWLDAAVGTGKDETGAIASVGDQVATWQDLSREAGLASFEYLVTASPNPELAWPLVKEVSDAHGLRGTHRVISFDGDDSLVCREGSRFGDFFGSSLDGGDYSVLLVFRAVERPDAGKQQLISVQKGEKKHAFGIAMRDGQIKAEIGDQDTGPLAISGDPDFKIAAATFKNSGEAHFALTGSSGMTVAATDTKGKMAEGICDSVRLGALSATTRGAKENQYFSGDLAEVLFYNRILSAADLEVARNYLIGRYFKGSSATPAGGEMPTDGLVISLDAEKDLVGPNGPALIGQTVSAWKDQSPQLGGANDFTVPPELINDAGQAPLLMRLTDEFGLKGAHRVIKFDGAQSLLLTTTAGPVADGLLGGPITVVVVAKLDAVHKSMRILSGKIGTEPKGIDLSVDANILRGGLRRPDGQPNTSEIATTASLFTILVLVADQSANQVQLFAVNANGHESSGERREMAVVKGPMVQLRLGAVSEFRQPGEANFLRGAIAQVHLYNRILSEAERKAVFALLSKRYFGR